MKDEQARIDKLEAVVFGTKPDGSDGLPRIVDMHSQTLYGTKQDPGGIEKAVRNQTRIIAFCAGVWFAVEFYFRVLNK